MTILLYIVAVLTTITMWSCLKATGDADDVMEADYES